MKYSIRIRLTAIYCAVFFISAAVLEIGAYAFLQTAIYSVVDRDLRSRLSGVEEFLGEHVGRLPIQRIRAEVQTHTALQPDFLTIIDEHGTPLFQAPLLKQPSLKQSSVTALPKVFPGPRTISSQSKPLRILTARTTLKSQWYVIELASDLTAPFEILRSFWLLMLISAPAVLLCASAAGYWISGRALAPVSGMIHAARRIGAGNLGERLTVPRSGDELQDLAETLNEMLLRIEHAFRHVTQFTADASHELRTPLAVIRAITEVALLRPSSTAESYREVLHRILFESEKNTALLDNLLQLARADSGTEILQRKPLDVCQSLRETCEQVELLARQKSLALTITIPPEPLFVSGVAAHLRRLWLICLDNAIKYTPEAGRISVTVSMVENQSAKFVSCEFRDSGIGIAEADLPRLFERFFRADKARSRQAGGSGLGLSLAKWIVDIHEGSMQVESFLNSGSTFRIVLPLFARELPLRAGAEEATGSRSVMGSLLNRSDGPPPPNSGLRPTSIIVVQTRSALLNSRTIWGSLSASGTRATTH